MRIMDTLLAYSYKPITENKVGSWRFVEPFLEDKLPPCQNECPLKHKIREIYSLIDSNEMEKAFYLMAEKNPILYSTGTVCPHFCEQGCNRQYVDESLNISSTEAFLGENFVKKSLEGFQNKKKVNLKVAIIGAGPAGLSAAYQLACYGAKIDLFEREAEAGGIVKYGIPDARVDKSLLNKEIERLFKSFKNISISYNKEIQPDEIDNLKKDYDFILLANGTHAPQTTEVKGAVYGIEALKNYHKQKYVFPKNGHYLVQGGGNTAMDVVFYLLENNNQVTVLVRREKEKMRAFSKEIALVEKKGAKILPLSELKEWNEKTKRASIKQNSGKIELQIDGIFACFGQLEEEAWKNIQEDSKIKKIGDYAGNTATVVHAIASGYQAAYDILASQNISKIQQESRKLVTQKDINLDYWKNKKEIREIDIQKESKRCMQCGTCTECKICQTFCPDFAIDMKNKCANFDTDYCKGCEICQTECPRGAISIREANKE